MCEKCNWTTMRFSKNTGWNLNFLEKQSLQEFITEKAPNTYQEITNGKDFSDYRFTGDKLVGKTRGWQYCLFFYQNEAGEKATLHLASTRDGEYDEIALSLKGLKPRLAKWEAPGFNITYDMLCELSAESFRR